MKNHHTSLELSRKLADARCKIVSRYWWYRNFSEEKDGKENWVFTEVKYYNEETEYETPAYDLLWDICIRHPKEFFGGFFASGEEIYSYHNFDRNFKKTIGYNSRTELITKNILSLLQQNKKEEAELYIWANTIFNPKNK